MQGLLQSSTDVILGCGGGAAAAGLLLMQLTRRLLHRKKTASTAVDISSSISAAYWLGHGVLCTGGAALIAAWAGGWACCDPLIRVVAVGDASSVTAMPQSLLLPTFEPIQQQSHHPSNMCDITTAHSAVGRRAVAVCCALVAFAFVACSTNYGNTYKAAWVADVARAVGLGGIFATIACNEDVWDWRPVYAVVIAWPVASFFVAAALLPGFRRATVSESVAAGWCLPLDSVIAVLEGIRH